MRDVGKNFTKGKDLLEVIREYWSLAPGVGYKFYKRLWVG